MLLKPKPCLAVSNHSMQTTLCSQNQLFFLKKKITILLIHGESGLIAMLHYVFPLSQLKVMDEASKAKDYTVRLLS